MSLVSLDSTTPASLTCDNFGVWLDDLPEDICCRIALFLNAMHENVLPLAEVSSTQRTAVKRGLDYKLSNHYSSEKGSQEFISHLQPLLRDDVRSILVTKGFPNCLQVCLRSPRLRELHLYDMRKYGLDNILLARNLRVLGLGFTGHQIPFPFPSGLSHLPIRELSIVFYDVCLHETLTDDPARHQLLAKWFPRVETLRLQCDPCLRFSAEGLRSSYLWRAVEHFPCLSEVTLTEPVPKDAYAKLKRISRVKLFTTRAAVAFPLIDKLYDRINMIRVSLFEVSLTGTADVDLIMQGQLERFNACTNLRSLYCSIQRGTEGDLAKVTKNLRQLWLGVNDDEGVENPNGVEAPPYEPEAGAILNAVRAAPHLEEITLNNMELRMSEVREILVETGIRLKEFTEDLPERLTIRGDFQYPIGKNREILQELTATIMTAALHNPSLKFFYLASEWHWFSDREVVKELLPRLEIALTVLYRHAPLLHLYTLDRLWCKLRCVVAFPETCLSEFDTSNESDSECSGTHSMSSGDSQNGYEEGTDSEDGIGNDFPQLGSVEVEISDSEDEGEIRE